MELDLITVLNKRINSMNLFAHSSIGLLREDDSLSLLSMPGGSETVYMDGSRDKNYQIQINAKSKDQMNCYLALTAIYQTLEQTEDLPSVNGSYEFGGIVIPSLPSLVAEDEQGFHIWQLSISAKITIYRGVV